MLRDYDLSKRAIASRRETAFERYAIEPEGQCDVSDFEVVLERGRREQVDYGLAAALMSAASGSPFNLHPPCEYVHFRVFTSVVLPDSRYIYAVANLCREAVGHPQLAFITKDSRSRVRQLASLEQNVRYATERLAGKNRQLPSIYWGDLRFSSSQAVTNVTSLWGQFLQTDEPKFRLICDVFFRHTPFRLS